MYVLIICKLDTVDDIIYDTVDNIIYQLMLQT